MDNTSQLKPVLRWRGAPYTRGGGRRCRSTERSRRVRACPRHSTPPSQCGTGPHAAAGGEGQRPDSVCGGSSLVASGNRVGHRNGRPPCAAQLRSGAHSRTRAFHVRSGPSANSVGRPRRSQAGAEHPRVLTAPHAALGTYFRTSRPDGADAAGDGRSGIGWRGCTSLSSHSASAGGPSPTAAASAAAAAAAGAAWGGA